MLISVANKHIKQGRKNKKRGIICFPYSKYCPVALALRDAGINVSVFETIFSSSKGIIITPRSVNRFIVRFDNGKSVKPFKFKFDKEKYAI